MLQLNSFEQAGDVKRAIPPVAIHDRAKKRLLVNDLANKD